MLPAQFQSIPIQLGRTREQREFGYPEKIRAAYESEV